jgi:hypothetical protein
VDFDIVEGENIAFIYAKFSRFVLLGEIEGISETNLKGTNVILLDNLIPLDQQLNEQEVLGFMIYRAAGLKSFKDLSLKQQEKNTKIYKDKLDILVNSDYWKALKKDL